MLPTSLHNFHKQATEDFGKRGLLIDKVIVSEDLMTDFMEFYQTLDEDDEVLTYDDDKFTFLIYGTPVYFSESLPAGRVLFQVHDSGRDTNKPETAMVSSETVQPPKEED